MFDAWNPTEGSGWKQICHQFLRHYTEINDSLDTLSEPQSLPTSNNNGLIFKRNIFKLHALTSKATLYRYAATLIIVDISII